MTSDLDLSKKGFSRRKLLGAAVFPALVGCAFALLGYPDAALAQTAAAPAGETYTNSIGMEFVRIPAGTFLMGSPDSDPEAREFKKPQHEVTISRPGPSSWAGMRSLRPNGKR